MRPCPVLRWVWSMALQAPDMKHNRSPDACAASNVGIQGSQALVPSQGSISGPPALGKLHASHSSDLHHMHHFPSKMAVHILYDCTVLIHLLYINKLPAHSRTARALCLISPGCDISGRYSSRHYERCGRGPHGDNFFGLRTDAPPGHSVQHHIAKAQPRIPWDEFCVVGRN